MNIRLTTRAIAALPSCCIALCALLLAGCGGDTPNADTPADAEPTASAQAASSRTEPTRELDPAYRGSGLSDEEMAAEPGVDDFPLEGIALEDAERPLAIEVFSERGYRDADDRLILDVMERDYLYLTLLIEDAQGRPVSGARPTITPQGNSRLVRMAGAADVSDGAGSYPFGLVGGTMGEEKVAIALGDLTDAIWLNVISLQAAGYGNLSEIEGALDWGELTQAEISWGEQISATFPPEVLERNGETVRLAGFMMPLTMDEKQSHFVMTSNPPSCFFHIPGGPAGAVEIFAKKPVAVGWEPIVLEGRFETLETSQVGTLYRLHDARVVEP